jgi:acyl-coenzyme A synthetase/AMP-(fatty) acid ligase
MAVSFQTIHSIACEQPSKSALVYNSTAISYAAFAGAIEGAREHLATHELPVGNTVVVLIHNLLDCWVTVLALQSCGMNTVCVGSVAIIGTLGLDKVAAIVTTEIEAHKHQLEPDGATGNKVITVPSPGYGSEKLPDTPTFRANTQIGGHILYTSGTTGNYKKLFFAAELQQKRAAERIEYCHADTICHCANYGLWTAVGYKVTLATWHAKGCVVLDQRPDWYQYFLQHELTDAVLIPDLVNQLHNALDTLPLPSPPSTFNLHVPGGFLSRKLAEQLIGRVTSKLIVAYGSSETNVAVLEAKVENLDDLHWLPSTGYRTIEIIDDTGKLCPIDVEGQLRIRLSDLDSCAYIDDAQATDKVFRSGYFYPGDMAVQRGDGRIRILGRSADVVNIRGQKLALAPIEHEIQNRLGVDNVCLFSGISNEGDEEVVIAMESEHWPEQSYLNNMGHEFAQFDQVRFALVYPFPRTQTGFTKIDRIALRKLVYPVQ